MKIIRVILVAATLAALSACSSEGGDEEAEALRSVRYVEVTEQAPTVTRSFSGITAAREELPLAFRVPGRVSEVRVIEGRSVTEGELIARLDNEEYALEVQRSQAALESARAQGRTVESSYERTRELYQNDSASRSEFETAQAALEAAQSDLVAAEAQLERAQLQFSYTSLRAPFAGFH